jgi:hypothetical protein
LKKKLENKVMTGWLIPNLDANDIKIWATFLTTPARIRCAFFSLISDRATPPSKGGENYSFLPSYNNDV